MITRYITTKKLKNNENYKTVFVNFNDKKTLDQILENKCLKIFNQRFMVSKFINKKIVQCFKCQKFGHTASICTSKTTICRFCAGEHNSKECGCKDKLKCSNCRKNHKSNSINCLVKQDKIIIKNNWVLKNEKMIETLNLHEETIKKAKKRFNIKQKPKKKTNKNKK